MKGFNFEAAFTQAEYAKLVAAVERRENYTFCYGKYTDKLQVRIYGTKCDNGVWKPDDYLWSITTQDRRGGFSGHSRPFRVSEMKSYGAIIDLVYDAFGLPRPAGFQQTFF